MCIEIQLLVHEMCGSENLHDSRGVGATYRWDMCRQMIGGAATKKLQTVPLLNDTVNLHIFEMASNIQCQVGERIKGNPFFSLQLEEFTDISRAA